MAHDFGGQIAVSVSVALALTIGATIHVGLRRRSPAELFVDGARPSIPSMGELRIFRFLLFSASLVRLFPPAFDLDPGTPQLLGPPRPSCLVLLIFPVTPRALSNRWVGAIPSFLPDL